MRLLRAEKNNDLTKLRGQRTTAPLIVLFAVMDMMSVVVMCSSLYNCFWYKWIIHPEVTHSNIFRSALTLWQKRRTGLSTGTKAWMYLHTEMRCTYVQLVEGSWCNIAIQCMWTKDLGPISQRVEIDCKCKSIRVAYTWSKVWCHNTNHYSKVKSIFLQTTLVSWKNIYWHWTHLQATIYYKRTTSKYSVVYLNWKSPGNRICF